MVDKKSNKPTIAMLIKADFLIYRQLRRTETKPTKWNMCQTQPIFFVVDIEIKKLSFLAIYRAHRTAKICQSFADAQVDLSHCSAHIPFY